MEILNTVFRFFAEHGIGIILLLFVFIMLVSYYSFYSKQEKEEKESYENPETLGEEYCGRILEVCRIEEKKILLWVEIYDPSYPLIPKKLWFLKDEIPKQFQNEKSCFKMMNTENGLKFINLEGEDSLTVKKQKYYGTYTYN